ncbi:MAG TPA: FG-GAP-like repeat-containing protein [Candidatus Cloacimonadota bacterium]|nr:FG-GAP-like repeat-containing protein [Candidatus Cloacimonadota bacterium]
MKRSVYVLIVCFGVQILSGLPWEQDNSVFNPSGIPSLTFSQPRFADLDNDGDKDFLLGNTNIGPLFIKNIGSANAPDFMVSSGVTEGISSLDAELAVCVDMDADGDLDLVSGGYTGLNFFRNDGSVSVPEFVEVPGYFSGLMVGENPVPDLADVDNDGDNDLVVGLSESGAVLLYTNIGSAIAGQFSQSQMLNLGDVGLYAYPIFCDLDSDGDQDILAGRDSHGFIYYQNIGSSSAGNWQAEDTNFQGLGMQTYWNSPDLVDLNNDGKYDLVFGTASGPLMYYVNTGTAAAPVWQANTSLFGGVLDVGGASSPVFYDFDGDGDLDLISGSQMGDIKYFENTGTPYSPAWAENNSYFSSIDHSIYAAVAIGDVNRDNLPDAIIGDLSGHLYYHRNTGMGFTLESVYLTDAALGGWSVPRLVDIDADGDLDIVAGNEAGNLVLFENTGTPRDPAWTGITGYFGGIDVGSNCSQAFGDIDGDGDYDFVAGNIGGNLACYLRQGFSWEPNSVIFSGISTDQNAAPALADLDHDGDLDLILGDYDGTFSYYRNLQYSDDNLNPPLNLSVSGTADAVLSWDPPLEGSSSPFERYNVYLNGDYQGFTTQQSWNFTGLSPNVTYTAWVTAQYIAGESLPAVIDLSFTGNEDDLMAAIKLRNYPNPFNPSTTISFGVKPGETAVVTIFDLKGRQIRKWSALASGEHDLVWDGRDAHGQTIGSGMYFCRVRTQTGTQTHKMMLIK